MKLAKLFLVCCIGAGVYHVVKTHREASAAVPPSDAMAALPPSANGFVAIPSPSNLKPGTVTIVAPLNCPRKAGRRAVELNQLIAAQGIPVTQTAEVQFPSGNPEDMSRINKVMMGDLPIVFIDGRAKNNPEVADIVAEYRSGHHR